MSDLLTPSAPPSVAAPHVSIIASVPSIGGHVAASTPDVRHAAAATMSGAGLLPVLCAGTTALLHGPRGVGLTHMLVGCAVALATGRTFLDWKASRAATVLLVTGSMPSAALQLRVREAMRRQHVASLDHPLRVVAPQSSPILVPDIGTASGRTMLAGLAAPCDVVVVDDLGSLMPGGKIDDEADFWHWLVAFRLAGKSVLVSQASGRNVRRRCDVQAHSLMQRSADTVIRLALPPGYKPTDGAHFEMHIDRARHLLGGQRIAREVQLRTRKGLSAWLCMPIGGLQRRRFCTACMDGMSVGEAAKAVGISRATAYRWVRDMQRTGDHAEEHDNDDRESAEIVAFPHDREPA